MSVESGVVIVGAGLAGLRTAEQLREQGFEGSITLLGDEEFAPYDRPPLSKRALKEPDVALPVLLDIHALDALKLDLRLNTRVVGLDPIRHTVTVADGSVISFGVLVIATGARPRLLRGTTPRVGLHTLRTFNDARAIASDIRQHGHIVVIGAGFIGCEVAATAREMGAEVALVEALSTPLSIPVGETIGQEVLRMHREHGVSVYCDSLVTKLVGGEHLEGVELSTGELLPAGAVVVGLGVTPTVDWLGGTDLAMDNGITCDASGHTSIEDVYAVGDVAHWTSAHGYEGRHEHWTSAIDQARVVAANIMGSTDESKTRLLELPYFWSDIYGVKIQALGWPAGRFESMVLHLGPASDKLVVLYSDDDRFVGIVGLSAPRIVMSARSMLQAGIGLDEAASRLTSSA
ncbi:MAG TPA: FAD-dependent oxidoreductase [Actinobacteria bacterium]|nr:FAD-dependent oxidoreductase [Actinomycetota bacterium]